MNKKTMKTILHTHWDREWYFTVEETQMYLRYLMENVFDYLEKNRDVKYLLDGQSVMLDDLAKYYESIDKYSDIIRNQIDLGPWYTQTDLTLPHGESIYRNLQIGLETARKYTDNPLLIAYSPDTFGHNPQMPQIYRGFGIDSTVFWRGYSKEMSESNVFDWTGIDGSEVKAISLPAGYQGAKYLPEEESELKERIDTIIEKYGRYGNSDKVLLMNGHDQMPIQKNIKELIKIIQNIYKDYDVEISDLRSYVDQYIGIKHKEVTGYLDHAFFTRVHRTIGSTRMDIKILNRRVENLIYNILEPLSLIAENYGIEYPHLLIEGSLKELMGTHAHDSLGGCNTDEVNQDIYNRIKSVERLIDNHIHIAKRCIANSITSDYDIFVFNLNPYTMKNSITEVELQVKDLEFDIEDLDGNKVKFDIVDYQKENMKNIDRQVLAKMLDIYRYKVKVILDIDSINGMDVNQYKIVESNESKKYDNLNQNYIEDDYYKIIVNKNSLDLYIKDTGKVIENFLSIENSGDDGDSYDYSPPKEDKIIGENKFDSIQIKNIVYKNLYKEIRLRVKNKLPYDLKDRIEDNLSTTQEYQLNIRLFNDSNIKVSLDFINKTSEQRTRLKVKSQNNIQKIIAGCQFGFTDIENNYELEKKSVQDKWVEKAVNIYNFQDKLLHDKNLSIEANQLNEFEYKKDEIYLTLIRSFGYMGKANLINRPNRASGMNLETPDALLEDVHFEFNFIINYVNINKIIQKYNIISYQNKEYNRFNINQNLTGKKKYSIELPLKEMNITAIKKSNDKEDILIRFYNPNDKEKINFNNEIYISDFSEKEIRKVTEIEVKRNQIKNIKI